MNFSHIWYFLSVNCVLWGNWCLDARDDYTNCITNWYIQIFLEFREWLVFKVFNLKDTNLLVKLTWPSGKQPTIFISSNSRVVFLTCSILSAKTDPLLCVDLVFWRELNKCFLYFLLESFFFAMLGILSTPLFWWVKWTILRAKSKNCPLWTTNSPLICYLRSVYRQSTCWQLKQNASNFLSNISIFLFGITWYLQLRRKRILSSWWAKQYPLFRMFFFQNCLQK